MIFFNLKGLFPVVWLFLFFNSQTILNSPSFSWLVGSHKKNVKKRYNFLIMVCFIYKSVLPEGLSFMTFDTIILKEGRKFESQRQVLFLGTRSFRKRKLIDATLWLQSLVFVLVAISVLIALDSKQQSCEISTSRKP